MHLLREPGFYPRLHMNRPQSQWTQMMPGVHLRKFIGEQPAAGIESTAGAVGGDTLLNLPLCSMAEEPGEQSQSLF